MPPSMSAACCRTGRSSSWADADPVVNPRIAAAARNPVRRAMNPPTKILRGHRERGVLRQDLAVLLVRHLDFETVRPFREALKRNPLPRLDAAVRAGRIETGRHRVVVERLRLGGVEPLLAAGFLAVERVGRLEAELLFRRNVRVVNLEEHDQ